MSPFDRSLWINVTYNSYIILFPLNAAAWIISFNLMVRIGFRCSVFRRVAQSKFGIPNVIWRIYFENSGEFVGSHQPSPMSHSDIIDSKPVSFTVEINWLSGFTSELVKRCEHMIYQIGCWMASKRAFFFSEANTYFWPVNSSYLDFYIITYPIHILYISYTYPPTSIEF